MAGRSSRRQAAGGVTLWLDGRRPPPIPGNALAVGLRVRTSEASRVIDTAIAVAGRLPCADQSLDRLVWSHVAWRWPDLPAAIREAHRVLGPGGELLVEETVVPGTYLKGKKGRQQREASDFLRALLGLRHQTPAGHLSEEAWQASLLAAGFGLVHVERAVRTVSFADWAGDSGLAASDRLRLQAMVLQAPAIARDYLDPQPRGDDIRFQLAEARLTAAVPA